MTAFLDSALKVISAPFASYWAIVLSNPVILTCQGTVSKRMHLSAEVRRVHSPIPNAYYNGVIAQNTGSVCLAAMNTGTEGV